MVCRVLILLWRVRKLTGLGGVIGAEVRMKETVSCSHMKGGALTQGRGPTVTVVLIIGD